jgi:diguanylate cyclase (GGDEF)-like protein
MPQAKEKQLVKQSPKKMDPADSFRADPEPSRSPDLPLMTYALEALANFSRDLAAMSRAVAHRENELRKLLELMETVEHGVLPEDVLGNIFESFSGVIPFERIGCAFLTEDGKRLVSYWVKSELGPVRIQKGYSRPLEGSSLETILASGQPRIINDLEAYLAGKPRSDATLRIVAEGGRSNLTCPLVFDGLPLGFLFFTSRQKNAYQDSHKYIFHQIASQVAASIQRSRLYQKLMEQNRSLLEKSRHLEAVATHDALTGVLNRGAIDEVLRGAYSKYLRSGQPYGVIMADLDHFKRINDKLGHSAGDLVLRECARRMSSVMRKTDAIGRYGGEEFVFVVDCGSTTTLKAAAERLRSAVSDQPFELSGGRESVSVSLGAALVHPAVTSAAALTALADGALYQAKANGRNCSVVASSDS